MRVTIIFHRLGPYHVARLEAAARVCELTAIELSAETGEYAWEKVSGARGFQRVTLFPRGDSRAAAADEVRLRVRHALDAARPEAVAIPGWSDRAAFVALAWCAERGVPAIVMSESTAHDEPRVAWKEFVKRRVVRLFSTALVGGRLHTAYLEQLGMARDRIFTGYDVVENKHFQKAETLKTEKLKGERGGGAGGLAKAETLKTEMLKGEMGGGTTGLSKAEKLKIQNSEIGTDLPSPPRPGRGTEGEVSPSETLKTHEAESLTPHPASGHLLPSECGEGDGHAEIATPHPSPLPGRSGEGAPFFLASARFIEKKNLPLLLRAYAEYREGAKAEKLKTEKLKEDGAAAVSLSAFQPFSVSDFPTPWSLVLLGDGPLRETLNSQLSTLNLREHVHLPGFIQYDELPSWYARASAFVHASSTEQWGLVVNEAVAAGLPVIVSNRCGCVPELVREGVNGFTFDPNNVEELAALLLKISAFNFPLSAFGAASREIASQHEPARFGEGLKQAAELAMKLPRPRANLFDRLLLNRLASR